MFQESKLSNFKIKKPILQNNKNKETKTALHYLPKKTALH
jgi:hypothetical protein